MLFFIAVLVQECFTIKPPLRIKGGLDAKLEEYPYIVRIEEHNSCNYTNNTKVAYNTHKCTASALTSVWAISAAHCLTEKYPIIIRKRRYYTVKKMVIRYGHVKNSPWMKDTFSDVLETVMHPKYMRLKIDYYIKKLRHDIGLLKTSPMDVGQYIKVSAVDYRSMYGHKAIAGGFGQTTKTNDGGNLVTTDTLSLMAPLQLLEVMLRNCGHIMTLEPCLWLASKCNEWTTACRGDSGGPVIHPSGLIAIMVLGQNCLNEIGPTYKAATVVPVTPYIEWIYSYVNA